MPKVLEGVGGGRATVGGEKVVIPTGPFTVEVPAADQPKLKKSWRLFISFTERTDPKGKKYVEADARLRLANGEYRKFRPVTVRYSPKSGYSLRLSSGQILNAGQVPVLDANGKPVIDSKTRLAIQGLTFTKSGNAWTPTGGTLSYQFLGQKGGGPVANFLR